MGNKLKILFMSSEVYPLAKTGGLADVAFALPKALKKLGHDVRIVMPCYKIIDKIKYNINYLTDFGIKINNFVHTCIIRYTTLSVNLLSQKNNKKLNKNNNNLQIPIYLIDSYEYFDRDGLYSGENGDYLDNAKRFNYFCRAAINMLEKIDFKPDIIHLNDWQTALTSLLVKKIYTLNKNIKNVKTVFTIHNLQYQGIFDMHALVDLDLGWHYFTPEYLEYYGRINLMKAGLIFSDAITVVSPNYAKEIQTPAFGMGLEGVIMAKKDIIYPIINGIDYDEWNPEVDPNIKVNYTIKDVFEKKKICKSDLQKEAKLPIKDVPVIGMVTRLADQKGFDILEKALPELLKQDIQLILLGTGDKCYIEMLYNFMTNYPEKCAFFLKFDAFIASKIYAGADFFLMPSRFEPCGIGQLIALKYGTIPIVRETGGLADTVIPFDSRTQCGNGFTFKEYNETALLNCINQALVIYQNKQLWNTLIKNAMSCNYSWNESALKYEELYNKLINKN